LPAEIQDAAIRNYVQDLASRIARNSDLKIPLEVRVFDNADTSSIALPGGFLFLTSGLLLACDTEYELAGVMSQQVAHIAARHATRASKRWMFSKILVPVTQVATGLLTGGVSNAGAYYGMSYGFQGLGMLVDRTVAGSNERAQKEADQLGIQYAWKAGFDPTGFVAFLDNVSRDAGSERSQSFLETKVPLGERLVDAFTEIQLLPPKENYTVDSADFRIAKSRLQSVISGSEGRGPGPGTEGRRQR
jgi:predicted Zn-dependent protease